MQNQLSLILQVVGPASSIIFAAWIFMGFLQQRFDAAVERYRTVVGRFRTRQDGDTPLGNMKQQALIYRRRCSIMSVAMVTGLVAAILLISTLIIGEFAFLFPGGSVLQVCGIATLFLGFLLVIASALCVMAESYLVHAEVSAEILDDPELAEQPGRVLRHVENG
jgi:hypothetical protein